MKAYKLKRGMFCFARSFLFSFFSRCGRFISRKIFPFCLCFLFLAGVFIIPSSAASEVNLIQQNMFASNSGWYWASVTPGFNSSDSGYTASEYKNKLAFSSSDVMSSGCIVTFTLDNYNADKKYVLSFDYYGSANKMMSSIYFIGNDQVQDDSGNQLLWQRVSNTTSWTHFDISFTPDRLINVGVNCFILEVVILGGSTNQGASNHYFRNLKLVETDDSSGFWATLWQWLQQLKDKLQTISTGLSTGFQNISTWLTNVKDGIVNGLTNALNSVKTAITNAIAGIQQWFIDLKDNIINFLKALFIPSAEFWDETVYEIDEFAGDHFGVVYQIGSIIAGFIVLLTRLNPSLTHTITMPAIEFNFLGETWHLSDAQTYSFDWVYDSSHPLAALYLIYRAFVFVILLFLFLDFCHKKYNQVINNFNPDAFDM